MHRIAAKSIHEVTIQDLAEIARRAFEEAREENRRLGIPNGFERDGKRLWEMPDGTITDVDPFATDDSQTPSSGDRQILANDAL